MNILRFLETYPDETSCRLDFRDKREKEGLICKKCKGINHYRRKSKWQWQCRDCGFRTSIRSGTIMENSNLPIRTWYVCIAFMSLSKKGISALEMQRQLGYKRYEPVWAMMHKIRAAMGCRDSLYGLTDMVEFDEGYFTKGIRKGTKTKRGRGSQNKQNVAVLVESIPLEDINTGAKTTQCRYFKMAVLPDHKSDTVDMALKKSLDQSNVVLSDKSTSYINIADYVDVHVQEKSDKVTTKTSLKWVHIAITNAKRWLLGIHHMVKGKYLQNYLNEFCYKLNRRYFGDRLFNRVSIAIAKSYWQD